MRRAARVWMPPAAPPPNRMVCAACARGAAPAARRDATKAATSALRVGMIARLPASPVLPHAPYLTRRETALNSGVPAASSHSNSTISAVTRETPNAPKRASAASLLAGAREPQASATT